jgi:hypothetical protein
MVTLNVSSVSLFQVSSGQFRMKISPVGGALRNLGTLAICRFMNKPHYSSEIGFGLNFHPFYLEHLGFGPLPFCE